MNACRGKYFLPIFLYLLGLIWHLSPVSAPVVGFTSKSFFAHGHMEKHASCHLYPVFCGSQLSGFDQWDKESRLCFFQIIRNFPYFVERSLVWNFIFNIKVPWNLFIFNQTIFCLGNTLFPNLGSAESLRQFSNFNLCFSSFNTIDFILSMILWLGECPRVTVGANCSAY
jgi:hypothetical protein